MRARNRERTSTGPARLRMLAPALAVTLGVAVAACDVAEDDTDEPVAVGEEEPRHEVEVEPGASTDGQELFANNCAACHQADGSGAGNNAILPLSPSGFVTMEDPEQLIRTVLDGRSGMPAFAALLSDEELAEILTHVRQLGENDADAVSADDVAAVAGDDADPADDEVDEDEVQDEEDARDAETGEDGPDDEDDEADDED